MKTRLLLFLSFNSYIGYSQLSKVSTSIDKITHIINANTSGYYAFGEFSGNLFVIRLDSQLNIVWRKNITDTIFNKEISFVKQQGDSKLIIGGAYSTQPSFTFYPGGFVLMLDSSGNLLIQFSISDYVIFQNLFIDSINNIYSIGNHFDSLQQRSDFLICKYDSVLNTVWSNIPAGPVYSRFPNSIFPLDTNGFIVFSTNPDGSDSYIAIDQFDSIGTRQLLKKWSFGGPTTDYLKVNRTTDNNYLFSSLSLEFNNDTYNFICYLNDSFNLKVKIGYRFQYNNGFTQGLSNFKSIVSPNGYIYCAGNITYFTNVAVCFMKLDTNLNIVWAYTIEDSTDAVLNDLIPTTDNGFLMLIEKQGKSEIITTDSAGFTNCPQHVFTNYATVPTPSETNVFTQVFTQPYNDQIHSYFPIVDTGNYSFNDLCLPLSILNKQIETKWLFTNGHGLIRIEFNERVDGLAEIYDCLGRFVYSCKVNDVYLEINTRSFSKGNYVLRISSSRRTENFKFINLN